MQAADWLGQHAPVKSVICHEPDLGFAVPPIGVGGPAYGAALSKGYQGVLLNWGLLYHTSEFLQENQSAPVRVSPENEYLANHFNRKKEIESWLSDCDWVILSDRFADQYLPLPDDFPAISQFYGTMLSGQHPEWHLAAEFRSLPGIFGINVDDRHSELTFRSFDHPSIWIFKRYPNY